MADILSKKERSALMAKVRSRGNDSTELRLIALFRELGITGWRRGVTLGWKRPKGRLAAFRVRPDFVFRRGKVAVFVDGCFWHACPVHGTRPKQNAGFWREKLARNVARDRLVSRSLHARGWRVMRIWEHELRRAKAGRLAKKIAEVFG